MGRRKPGRVPGIRAKPRDDRVWVTCERCGWTGPDTYDSDDKRYFIPCPACQHPYARYADRRELPLS